MAAHHITIARGVSLEEFLLVQQEKRLAYVYSTDEAFAEFLNEQLSSEIEFSIQSRLEFLASVTRYFRCDHAILQDMLQQRHNVVLFHFT